MHLSFAKLKSHFPKLNERPISIEECYEVAIQSRITLLEMRLHKRGYHLFNLRSRRDFIALRKGMKDLQFLETFFHELAHICAGCSEFEANAFRLIAIIPTPYLESYDWLDENCNRYALKLWRERLRLRFLYQI